MKEISQYINESMNNITKLVDKAIEEMTSNAIDNIDYEFLSNADDLKKCKDNDIAFILNLTASDNYLLQKLDNEHFNVADVIKKYKHVNVPSVIDTYVKDNWQDDLDDDVVDALNDFFDIGGIVNKTMLNGGKFEAFRDFQIAIERNVINKIRKSIK